MKINFSPFPVLNTQRLKLRHLLNTDAEAIHLLRSDARVNKMLGRETSEGIADALAFIDKINDVTASKEGIYWVVELKEDNRFTGTVCLYNFDSDKQEAEIGYELLPAYYGKGIAAEAVAAVIDHAFKIMGASVINATPAQINIPSIKLLKTLNFKLAGSFTVGPEKVVLLDYRLKR